MKERERKIKM